MGLRKLLQARDTKYKAEKQEDGKAVWGFPSRSPWQQSSDLGKQPSARVRFSKLLLFCWLLACHIIWTLLTFKDDPIFSEGEHRGASLPKAAELWLCRRLAGAPHSWAAQNSLSNTSYRRAPSQSPAPAHFRAVQLLKLNNIPQLSLPRKPPYIFYYVFCCD